MYEVENGVGTILLNRPERKNAFTLETCERKAFLTDHVHRIAYTLEDLGTSR